MGGRCVIAPVLFHVEMGKVGMVLSCWVLEGNRLIHREDDLDSEDQLQQRLHSQRRLLFPIYLQAAMSAEI